MIQRATVVVTAALSLGLSACQGDAPECEVLTVESLLEYACPSVGDAGVGPIGRIAPAPRVALPAVPSSESCGCGDDLASVPTIQYISHPFKLVANVYPCSSMHNSCSGERYSATIHDEVTTVDHSVLGTHSLWVDPDTGLRGGQGWGPVACEDALDFNWYGDTTTGCSVLIRKVLRTSDMSLRCSLSAAVADCLRDNVWRHSKDDPAPEPTIGNADCVPDESDPVPWGTPEFEQQDNTCVDEQGWLSHRLQTDAWRDVSRCIERAFRDLPIFQYSLPDGDDDGVCDAHPDNCPFSGNPNQRDFNCDDQGDACEQDVDGDGVEDTDELAMAGSIRCADTDDDHVLDYFEARAQDGDLDDQDSDGDGLSDRSESGVPSILGHRAGCNYDDWSDVNCPGGHYNVRLANVLDYAPLDSDGDDIADFADTDSDNDGVPDGLDKCRTVSDSEQLDLDEDGTGDACDPDRDGDAEANEVDNCPDSFNPPQGDVDDDGVGDDCDLCPGFVDDAPSTDLDSDGVGDACDLCPDVATSGPDADDDDDGVGDECDMCPGVADPEPNADYDQDGFGDACDLCPGRHDEYEPADFDEDGVGDDCEPAVTITSPSGDPVVSPNPSNELVYDTTYPGVLRGLAAATLSTMAESRLQYDVAWEILDPMGGVSPTFAPWESASGNGAWVLATTFEYVGLPAMYSDFGLKRIRVTLSRNGILVAASEPAEFEVFWPMFHYANAAVKWTDANYVRNFPGSAEFVVEPLAGDHSSYTNESGQTEYYTPVAPPNWFYYWMQSTPQGEMPYSALQHARYVVSDNEPPLARAVTVSGFETPVKGEDGAWVYSHANNLTLFTSLSVKPAFPSAYCGILSRKPAEQFHAALRHEFEHVDQHLTWGHERTGHQKSQYGDVYSTRDWSHFGPDKAWYTNFADVDGNGAITRDLSCELDGVLGIAQIRESQVTRRCDSVDIVPGSFHINASATDDFVWEWDVEPLDWDLDGVPNWKEAFVPQRPPPECGRLSDLEQITNAAAEATLVRIISGNLLQPIDWGAPGVNYGTPNGP